MTRRFRSTRQTVVCGICSSRLALFVDFLGTFSEFAAVSSESAGTRCSFSCRDNLCLRTVCISRRWTSWLADSLHNASEGVVAHLSRNLSWRIPGSRKFSPVCLPPFGTQLPQTKGSACVENENVLDHINSIPPKPLSPARLKNVPSVIKRWLPDLSQRNEGVSSVDSDRPAFVDDTNGKKNCLPFPASSTWLPSGVTLPHQPPLPSNENRPLHEPAGVWRRPEEKKTNSTASKTADESKGCNGDGTSELADGGCERNSSPTSLPGNVDWDEYRSFLLRVWEENSLDSSSLDAESSTLPSLSSISGGLPFAIDLLTEKMFGVKGNVEKCSPQAKAELRSHSSLPPPVNFWVPAPSAPSLPANERTRTPKPHGALSGKSNFVLRPRNPPQIIIEEVFCPSRTSEEESKGAALSPREKINARPIPPVTPLEFQTTNDTARIPPNSPIKTDTWNTPPETPQESKTANEDKESWSSFRAGHKYAPPCLAHEDEIATIKKELLDARKKIQLLSAQMENQSSHLERLIETKNSLPGPFEGYPTPQDPSGMSYPVFPQGYKASPHAMYPQSMSAYEYNAHHALGRRTSCQYPCEAPRGRATSGFKGMETPGDEFDPRALESLRDRIVALQMQNIELNLFLKKEELRRKEAEDAVRKEKEHVQKLQNSLQDLSTSTLVMDPLTYKQVADKYIASRKKPVRRTHTCNPSVGSSDLVCDSTRLQVIQNSNQSTSCPSSPLGSKQGRKMSPSASNRLSPPVPLTESTQKPFSPLQKPPHHGKSSSEAFDHIDSTPSINWSVEARAGTPLKSKDYPNLLQSLGGLGLSSSQP